MQDSPTPIPSPAEARPVSLVRTSFWGALSWVRDLAFSVLIAVILIVFIYQPVKVEGTSMMPTLTDQERIFINKFTYHFGLGSIERGDMVVFWFPLDPSKSYIKRVIGVPGDRVYIDAGQVFVNDHALTESSVPEDNNTAYRGKNTASHPASTSCWAIIVAPPVTAAPGASSSATPSTAKPFSSTGR